MNPLLVVGLNIELRVIKRQDTVGLKPQKTTAFNSNSALRHYY